MEAVIAGIVCFFTTAISSCIWYAIGYRRGLAAGEQKVGWLTRPHTPQSIEKFPDPEVNGDPSTVQEATWVRNNAPGSNARWS